MTSSMRRTPTWPSTSSTPTRATRAPTRSGRTSRSRAARTATRSWSTRVRAPCTSCTPPTGTAARPTAGSGAVFDLASNALRPDGWTSADAAGLPIFAGLLRYDEVVSGVVDHAIRMTVSCTHDAYVWPARHRAGTKDRRCPPMGARFRLRAGFDARSFDPETRVVIRAMKLYGMIVADNGSDWYFQGTVDPGWPASLIEQLKQIPARAFVAVDEHACRVAPDSGQFAYGPGCPAPVASEPVRGSSPRSSVPRG